jgi:uncharacterized protein (DUF952 family)
VFIVHLARCADWDAAVQAGSYRVSTRGRSLDEGASFIHASYPEQVSSVANFVYADETEPLCLLVIDTDRLTAPVRDEDLDGGGTAYPHIYGPLNLDAVVGVQAYDRSADGRFPALS